MAKLALAKAPDQAPAPARAWPADKVERRPVAELVPYARNARTHDARQVAQLAASIAKWGWTIPILLDEAGAIIAGHGRVLAAKKLKLADVPCMIASGWTEAEKQAYRIADNQLALNSDWDAAALKLEFGELQGVGFDLALTGFANGDLQEIIFPSEHDRSAGLYSGKLRTPAYIPRGDAPAVSELLDAAKTKALQAEIAAADLDPALAAFLNAAAERHTVFDFHRIADFYAAASPEIQRMMERSALVIIDIDSAIEQGFVRLNDRLTAMAPGPEDEE